MDGAHKGIKNQKRDFWPGMEAHTMESSQVIPALERQKQEHHKFEASLGYIESSSQPGL
jgi:hypothetical protein